MSVYVFLGPTLAWEDARRELDAVFCAPAAVGDVYRAVCNGARAIGIVDGFFEQTPSVWHKEILWAMSEGVRVFGASSMGALRAAELADYGMIGVGQISSAFREGRLEDDDEVAVAHAGKENGYRALSEAMVSIRATLEAAAAQGIIGRDTCKVLERTAKGIFYPDRSYERILREAAANAPVELEALRAWLPRGRIDAKRTDALEMLRAMRVTLSEDPSPMRVAYRFEHTHTWRSLQRYCGSADARPLPGQERAILDELRLRGRFSVARRAGTARLLALTHARASGKPFPTETLHQTMDSLRRQRGLLELESTRKWLDDNNLGSAAELERLLRDEARVRWVDGALAEASIGHIADHLRLTGEYSSLRERVTYKEQILSTLGVSAADPVAPSAVDDQALWRWYFLVWMGKDKVPDDVESYALASGFPDSACLRRAVLCEYLVAMFERLPKAADPASGDSQDRSGN